MNYYRYKIMAPSGKVSSGLIRLPYDNEFSVITHLERSNNTVIHVSRLNWLFALVLPLFSGGVKKKIPRSFIADSLANLSVMLRAGLTINAALHETTEGSNYPAFNQAIETVLMDIEMGSSFSEAAAKHPHAFPRTAIQLIRIGEESGKLEKMLKDAAEHLKRLDQIISDTRQALIYPAFVFVALGFGMGFWFYYVVPKILELFLEMEVKLPPLTLFILSVSTFFQENIWVIAAVATGLTVSLITGVKKNTKIQKGLEQVLLQLPIARTIMTASNLAFITEYFSILLNAGMDIRRSLAILVGALGNEVYKEKLGKVSEVMGLGGGVADSFQAAAIFPSFVVRMISVGEQSGTLPEQLEYIAADYRNKLNVIVSTIGKMIEPLVLIVAGAMFAVIIAGLFLPIYDLVSQVSGR